MSDMTICESCEFGFRRQRYCIEESSSFALDGWCRCGHGEGDGRQAASSTMHFFVVRPSIAGFVPAILFLASSSCEEGFSEGLGFWGMGNF